MKQSRIVCVQVGAGYSLEEELQRAVNGTQGDDWSLTETGTPVPNGGVLVVLLLIRLDGIILAAPTYIMDFSMTLSEMP